MPRLRRPKVRTRCAHCGRKREPRFIEWHPGIEEWQCSDFADCDAHQGKATYFPDLYVWFVGEKLHEVFETEKEALAASRTLPPNVYAGKASAQLVQYSRVKLISVPLRRRKWTKS